LAAIVGGLSISAGASTPDHRTHFTFSQPITLPGLTLPAGTYTFRVADHTAKVVQVLNGNGTESYAMLMSIPAYRQDVAMKPEISFMETAADKPAAVQTWWREGTRLGYEFIYPREQVARLTRAAAPTPNLIEKPPVFGEGAVAAIGDDAAEASAPAVIAAPDDALEQAESNATGAAAPQEQTAQPAPVFEPQSNADGEPVAREELPATATVLPLALALGGLMALGGAWLKRGA
jgi:hypothetical protein